MERDYRSLVVLLAVYVSVIYCSVTEATAVDTVATVEVWTREIIRLPCHFEEEPFAVLWVKESSSNQQRMVKKASFFENNFLGKEERFTIDKSYSLVITDLHLTDEGRYHCELVLANLEVFSNSTLLTVRSPVVDTVPTVQGWRGQDIRLPCDFQEEPFAVYWYKESVSNPDTSTTMAFFAGNFVSMTERFIIERNFNLFITDLEVADGGVYRCQLLMKTFEVHSNSSVLAISSMASTHEIEECDDENHSNPSQCSYQTPQKSVSFNLTCVVSGFMPNISMFWTESGMRLYSVISRQTTLSDSTYKRSETIAVTAKQETEQTFLCKAFGKSVKGASTAEIIVLPIYIPGKQDNTGVIIGRAIGILVVLIITFLLVGKCLQKYFPDYLPQKGSYPTVEDERYTEHPGGRTRHILTEKIDLIDTCGITDFTPETLKRLEDELRFVPVWNGSCMKSTPRFKPSRICVDYGLALTNNIETGSLQRDLKTGLKV
ncbi:uncharacterized protein [Diadema setosum]|uniref:uncharacterized protein n=1 Tax=Diadema setosum TaxID=31175 RepID=UPI003B3A710D